MNVRPLPGQVAKTRRILWVAAALAICLSFATAMATAASSPSRLNLAGTWSGKYSGAFSGTFRIQWKQTGGKLQGTIKLSSPRGTYGINGSVHGKKITFGAVGAGATYTGSATSKAMSGRYKSPQGGGSWSAHKCKSRTTC